MMELENGMVSGSMPYNLGDAPAKAIKCPWCKRAVDGDENVYDYCNAMICADCLKAEVGNMSPDELAIMLDVGIEKARYL